MEYKSLVVKNKIDWFVKDKLEQTFNSYEHVSQFFKKYYEDHTISSYIIRKLINGKKNHIFRRIQVFNSENEIIITFKTNLEFMQYFNIGSATYTSLIIKNKYYKGYIIKVIDISPDIRKHIYESTQNIEQKICNICNVSKPLTDQFYNYINKQTKHFRLKCKDCNNLKLGNKNSIYFMEKVFNEDWKNHPEYDYLYFEKESNKIFSVQSGLYITRRLLIKNKQFLLKNLKWEAFNGKILQNMIVKYKNKIENKPDNEGIELSNLECVYIYCENCKKIIEKPKSIDQIFCSKKCQRIIKQCRDNHIRNTYLENYIKDSISKQKFRNKKYIENIDYDTNYLISLGTKCFYCNIDCLFGYDKNCEKNHTETLTYDKKNPDIGYCKENVVQCCWFCNRMKNKGLYEEWKKLIIFLKDPSINILDLSDKKFASSSTDVNTTNIYYHLREKSPKYYYEIKIAKNIFIDQVKKQNKLDGIFNFFPLIYLNQNCLFNSSIDAIDTNLENCEKHRPDNIQIIPRFLNYGKNTIDSNEKFVHEFKKRNFKINFDNCKVILPDQYENNSYFNKLIQ